MNNSEKNINRPSRRLRTIAVIPSLFTLLNGVFGFAAIHFTARGISEPPDKLELLLHNPQLTFFAAAAWMIVLAMFIDAIDGFVARMSGSASDFGGQLDSLSDVISFGVAPAFLMLRVVEQYFQESATPFFGSFWGRLLWLVAAMYICCSILRLARFNVENTPDESSHKQFSGLPTPAAAGVLAALVLLYSDIPELKTSSHIIVYLLPFVTFFIALLMVSNIPYAHVINQFLKGRKPFEYLVLIVLVSIPLFWKLQLTLALISTVYALSGTVIWLWRKRREMRKTAKAKPSHSRNPVE